MVVENKLVDAALFVETFEQEGKVTSFPKRTYQTFSKIRKSEIHGGIKLVVKNEFEATELTCLSEEQLSVKLNYKDANSTGLILTAMYLKPNLKKQSITKEFESLR